MSPTPIPDTRALTDALDRALTHALNLTHALDHADALDHLDHAVTHAHPLDHALALALARALARARDIDLRARAHAHAILDAVTYAHRRAATLGVVGVLGLNWIRTEARRLVDVVDEALADGGESGSAWVEGRRPSRVAVRVARYAVRVVPVRHRCRYDEEFQGELTEIAQEHGGWGQLAYAMRVLGRDCCCGRRCASCRRSHRHRPGCGEPRRSRAQRGNRVGAAG